MSENNLSRHPIFLDDIMNDIDEEWRPTNAKARRCDTIIEVSNRGRIKRKNGDIGESTYHQLITIKGKRKLIHRFIAEHFLPPPKDKDKKFIDHRTHTPKGINVNDVDNLRWCTKKENNNFSEAKENQRKAQRKIQKILHEKYHLNKPRSEFGRKYIDHYGYSYTENIQQYRKEWKYYHHHGKCRWE